MSLLHEIHSWSQTLKPCLSDALRRLLQNTTLTDEDHDDLFALLLSEAGIPDSKTRVAVPLDLNHLPSVGTAGTTLRLLSLKNFKNVNRIAEDQKLEFVPVGLTVIYGENGTGKSGYSRVLKLACRARGVKGVVLPNAHVPKKNQGVPEAKFVIDHNGKESTLQWQHGTPMHIDLTALSVFDSQCARTYIDTEQDVAYLPYGLDLVENLAQIVIPELAKRLTDELKHCTYDPKSLQEFHGLTEVGKLISSLSADTDKAKVVALAALTGQEKERFAALQQTLKEADPKSRAASIRRVHERLKAVQQKINSTYTLLNDNARDKLKEIDKAAEDATTAEFLAAKEFRSRENLLHKTGGTEWQALFESARRFAVVAYQDNSFPVSLSDDRCLLCQQPLGEGKERLKRFEKFIKDDTASLARQKRSARDTTVEGLGSQPLSFGLDTTLIEELNQYNEAIPRKIISFQAKLEERRTWLKNATDTHQWTNCPPIEEDPRGEIVELLELLRKQAASHDLAADEESRLKLQQEFNELDARVRLASRKECVLELIDKLKRRASLESCNDHIKKRPITDKSKELANLAVTNALEGALNREFKALRVEHLKVKLTSRAVEGKMYHKLIMDLPNSHKLPEILSEGEQRAMAIASFLAELSVAGHTGGAIFDDPVSSLDHHRRVLVAERLVQEAKHRQIIVFTHDAFFLGELRSLADRTSVQSKCYHLEWTTGGEFAGYCNDGLPWHHQSFKDRIDAMEKEQRQLQKDWLPTPNSALRDRMRTAYSHFRQTIERAVERVFLNGVVRRFENYVPLKNLELVVSLTRAEYDELYRLFTAASDVTDGHDLASAGPPLPEPRVCGQS